MKTRVALSTGLAMANVLCGHLWASSAPAADAFARANDEYAAGHFRESAGLYEQAAQGGQTTATVFYDLGNAWFRAGDLGRAILNYERALTLQPQHPEAAANLQIARDKARALQLRDTWRDRVTRWAPAVNYSLVAAVSFWFAAFALCVLFLARRRSAVPLAVFAVAVLVFAAAVCSLYARESGARGRWLSVIVGSKIEARLATADNAGTVLALPAGSEVKILSTRGDWSYAELPNELRGWIPAQSAERVRL